MTLHLPPRLVNRVSAWSFAARLHALDRWPVVVSDPRIWNRMHFAEPFGCRWKDHPVPPEAQRAFDSMDHAAETVRRNPGVVAARKTLDRRTAQRRLDRGSQVEDCNVGRGGRTANTMQVAIAADAHLDGATATAMPWNDHRDPVLVCDVHSVVPTMGGLERARTRAEAEDLVRAWGPGAKGIMSVRDPNETFHRLLNVTNRQGVIAFLDYSRGADPVVTADAVLRNLDGSSPFAGIQLWRTRNIPEQSRLPDDVLRRSDTEVRDALAAALPDLRGTNAIDQVADRIRFFDDFGYVAWITERCHRDACTFLASEIDALPYRRDAQPITTTDAALLMLIRHGRLQRYGEELQILLPDDETTRKILAGFAETKLRSGPIDGLPPGWIEAVIAESALEKYEGPPLDGDAEIPTTNPIPDRTFSWIDVNRAMSPGQRKTNCWNCTASVAHWLQHHEPSTALPIYPKSSFRPTIPQYLRAMGAGDTTFVGDRSGLEAVVRSWPPNSHGVVVASFNPSSTHMFNVVRDGDRIRYLDGYVGRDGDYNFDITWEKLAVAPLGAVHHDFR